MEIKIEIPKAKKLTYGQLLMLLEHTITSYDCKGILIQDQDTVILGKKEK